MVSLIALTMAFVPYYGSIYLLFAAITLNGIGGGSWDSSNNIWLVEMWPNKHASVMQSSQFMYGLGTIISPALISPYVSGNSSQHTPAERIESLRLPFTIVGVIQILVPIILLILFFIRRYRKPGDDLVDENDIEEINNNHISQYQSLRKFKLILVALLLGAYDAAELGYFYYSPTMLQHLKVEPSEAAHVLSVLSAAYTIGRLVTAFISLKLTPDIIMTYHLVIIIAAQTCLYFGRHNLTIIYITTALLGFGFSAMWPAILAFTERHFKLSNRIGSLLFFFAGLATIFTPFLIARYLETWPEVLFVFEGSYLVASIILFISVKLLLVFRP
ncbi:hypothetical protein BLA29_005916 [Euroglyphus maynei]|uniref:Major facilitator superfamily (MFS) profile domain-containing protein n=1 Tax=Euroglyphus maynei TaxID=6958 RepID=A0A1Y3ASS0_EURMA|nr:hypothetical protein BLA29_005916 [Euroglyphus maynei]